MRNKFASWCCACGSPVPAEQGHLLGKNETTGLGKHFPFYVTAIEVRCSEDRPEQFRLYRVFDFAWNPRVYVISGDLSKQCWLEPIEYRALI